MSKIQWLLRHVATENLNRGYSRLRCAVRVKHTARLQDLVKLGLFLLFE